MAGRGLWSRKTTCMKGLLRALAQSIEGNGREKEERGWRSSELAAKRTYQLQYRRIRIVQYCTLRCDLLLIVHSTTKVH